MASEQPPQKIQLPDDLLEAFAKYIIPDLQHFYETDEGKKYYTAFIAKHPELLEDEDADMYQNQFSDDEDDDDDY